MKLFLKIIIVIIILLLAGYLTGYFLPKDATIRKEKIINKPSFFVWAAITNHYEETLWRTDLDTTEQLEDKDGLPFWKEKYVNGDSLFLVTTTEVNNRLIVRNVVNSDIYEGTMFIINISSVEGGTKITYIEERNINKPIYRLINYFKDPSEKLQKYLDDLANKFEKEAEEENSSGW